MKRTKRANEAELEEAIRSLLRARREDATICPSEAARAIGGEAWREQMDAVRDAARRMVRAGEIEITQHGEVVDPDAFEGPIRLRKKHEHVHKGK